MRRLWRRRAAAVPAPPPAAGSSELQGPAPKGQRFWRWLAVMLLATAVALIPQFRDYLAGAGDFARELVRGTPSVAATPVIAPGTGRAREDEKADGTATATPQPAASYPSWPSRRGKPRQTMRLSPRLRPRRRRLNPRRRSPPPGRSGRNGRARPWWNA